VSPRAQSTQPRSLRRRAAAIAAATALTAKPSFEWPGARPPRPHKYAAQAVVVDGHRFDSTAEARRYGELRMLERAGMVVGLVLQPRFELHAPPNGVRIGCYVADFAYEHPDDGFVVEDVKGVDLPLGRWKRKHCEAEHGVRVRVMRRTTVIPKERLHGPR